MYDKSFATVRNKNIHFIPFETISMAGKLSLKGHRRLPVVGTLGSSLVRAQCEQLFRLARRFIVPMTQSPELETRSVSESPGNGSMRRIIRSRMEQIIGKFEGDF